MTKGQKTTKAILTMTTEAFPYKATGEWSKNKIFVAWLTSMGIVRMIDGELCHRVAGEEEGMKVVWDAWNEGIEQGDPDGKKMGLYE